MEPVLTAGYLFASYLVGGIPFGLFIGRAMGGVDVRTVGSGNIGATNVLRAAGKSAALLTLIADCPFGFNNDEPQGICADVQQTVYDTILNTVLTPDEQDRYLSQGKQLSFIMDDDLPPLDNTTNPVGVGSFWLTVDPATKVTTDGNRYYYEPWSLSVAYDDPDITDERLKGVRYCKLLSHQAILSWMLEKSFEENPVLITPTSSVCDKPSALESGTNGSCLLYFALAQNYYCMDFTGPGFTPASAQEKCETSPTYTNPRYDTLPCSQRTTEIETYIPGYVGLTGICVIHCKATNEFIWNIYTENPEPSCEGYDFFTPEELWEQKVALSM